jgi:adenylate cyclase
VTAALALGRPGFLNGLENTVYDTTLRGSTRPVPDSRVVIVDVDEASIAKVGQWPWPRDAIGRLIDRLRELGASAIALDMVFPEPDRSGGFVPSDDERVQRRTPDDALAEGLRGGKVVLGYALTFNRDAERGDNCQLHPLNLTRPPSTGRTGSAETPFFQATGAVCSLASLAVAAGRSGFLNATPDEDGVLRRAPLLIELEGQVYPSLPVAAVLLATASQQTAVRAAFRHHVRLALGERLVAARWQKQSAPPLPGTSANISLRFGC